MNEQELEVQTVSDDPKEAAMFAAGVFIAAWFLHVGITTIHIFGTFIPGAMLEAMVTEIKAHMEQCNYPNVMEDFSKVRFEEVNNSTANHVQATLIITMP